MFDFSGSDKIVIIFVCILEVFFFFVLNFLFDFWLYKCKDVMKYYLLSFLYIVRFGLFN